MICSENIWHRYIEVCVSNKLLSIASKRSSWKIPTSPAYPAYPRVSKSIPIPPKISSVPRFSTNKTGPRERERETELTYFTHHRLFFYSIVSGLRNWTPDESPKDFRRCWGISARWSGSNKTATKRPRRRGIRKSRGSSRSIYLAPPIENLPSPLVVELSFRLLLSPFLFYCSSRQ